MWQALKARDLQRDPRFALHSGSAEPTEWEGTPSWPGSPRRSPIRRRSGTRTARGAPGASHLFRLELIEVSTVGLNEESATPS